MTASDELLKKRMLELARISYNRGYACFTGFLDLHEQNIYHSLSGELSYVSTRLWGGWDLAERQMLAFSPDALSLSGDFPIRCLRARTASGKFSEELTHRDYLGALMNLGIDRSRLGDILVTDDGAYIFCEENIAPWLGDSFTTAKHTKVSCSIETCESIDYTPRTRPVSGTVSSVRLDAILPLVWKGSRSSLSSLIPAGSVYVNGKLVLQPGFHPKEGDVISVRGYGKCRLMSIGGLTKKGRTSISAELYV